MNDMMSKFVCFYPCPHVQILFYTKLFMQNTSLVFSSAKQMEGKTSLREHEDDITLQSSKVFWEIFCGCLNLTARQNGKPVH